MSEDASALWDRLLVQQHQFMLGPPGMAKSTLIRRRLPLRTRVRYWLSTWKPEVRVSTYEITIEIPDGVRRTKERWRQIRSRFQSQCSAVHPETGWRCGNWDYALSHRLYRKGHKGPHAACGRVEGRYNGSINW